MTPTLFITDSKMLELLDFCQRNRLKGVKTRRDFADAIGFQHQNLPKISKGVRGFTSEQLYAAGKIFGVSMDWLFGFSEEMFRSGPAGQPKDVLQALKGIVHALEQEREAAPVLTPPPRTVKQKVKQNAGGE